MVLKRLGKERQNHTAAKKQTQWRTATQRLNWEPHQKLNSLQRKGKCRGDFWFSTREGTRLKKEVAVQATSNGSMPA